MKFLQFSVHIMDVVIFSSYKNASYRKLSAIFVGKIIGKLETKASKPTPNRQATPRTLASH